jgi:hypothetical protein
VGVLKPVEDKSRSVLKQGAVRANDVELVIV